MTVRILTGDCRDLLATLPAQSVNCCVTSPPYFGLRDYGVDGQMGLEATPDEFVAGMVAVFRDVRRVLRDDGTLWLNIGDSYSDGGSGANGRSRNATNANATGTSDAKKFRGVLPARLDGLKPKDLIGIPWRLAKALQEPYYTGRIRRLEDRVWLAAMIDGEGCLFIHKRKAGVDSGAKFTKADGTVRSYRRTQDTYGCGLEVANTNRAIVERCLQIAGVGSICEQAKDRRQILYRWNVRSNECRRIIEEVYPHLVGKQHQARLLLGCPSSGNVAADAHSALIYLHNGLEVTTDFPPPKSLFEPGWYLRQDIIWSKCNPMPESVRDRCTKAHEYLFLLSKGPRYFYDAEAIAEPLAPASIERLSQVNIGNQSGSARVPGKTNGAMKAVSKYRDENGNLKAGFETKGGTSGDLDGTLLRMGEKGTRNRRSVWEVATQPFSEAHFATFPPALIEPCILAGCPTGGTVIDPFFGAGTTGLVADRLGRDCIGIELNESYADIAKRRIEAEAGFFSDVVLDPRERLLAQPVAHPAQTSILDGLAHV